MFRITCLLSVMAALALVAPSTAQAPAEPQALPDARRMLCPMPVAEVREHDSIRTIRPNAGIEYFIQAVPVPCDNPL